MWSKFKRSVSPEYFTVILHRTNNLFLNVITSNHNFFNMGFEWLYKPVVNGSIL